MQGKTGLNLAEGQGLSDQRPFISEDALESTIFTIDRDAKEEAGRKHYRSYDELEQDFG